MSKYLVSYQAESEDGQLIPWVNKPFTNRKLAIDYAKEKLDEGMCVCLYKANYETNQWDEQDF